MCQAALAVRVSSREAEGATYWKEQADACQNKGNTNGQVDALVNLSAAYQALGQHPNAVDALTEAVDLAKKGGDRSRLILAKGKLGAAWTMMLEPKSAEPLLRESLEMARADKNKELTAVILNDLGDLLLSEQKDSEALSAFEESSTLARASGNELLTAQALCNAAASAARSGMAQKAEQLNSDALTVIERLEPSHQKAFLLVNAGQTDSRIKPADKEAGKRLLLRARQSYERAIELAAASKDQRVETFALGYMGQLYEQDHQLERALSITRRAAFVAQQAELPEALYRWEWQAGRLLKQQGEPEQAIAEYRRAVQTLQPIRHDVALGYGNATSHASFRQTLGPLFYELADLLLQQAVKEREPTKEQQLLREARDTVEQLKSVELEDYFQDNCVNVLRAKAKSVENLDPGAAVIYLIPLSTRTEVLVSLTSGIHRFTANVGADELTAQIREFRHHLETRTSNAYLGEARQLYDWLIRPVIGLLTANKINTLVFVPDGALQTIPLAALQDGKRFLIEKFAVAVSPGLSLMEPHPARREHMRLLVGGLSDSVQGFPSLDYVPAELKRIEPVYQSEALMNTAFVMPALRQKLTQEQFSIVHLASHGQFNSDAHKTFVLTYDDKLTLNNLEALIRPSQYRGKPVELLVLSACQTASGDDRAALGLAGVAVKAGARSALASLWSVNDQSTSELVSEFYHQLRESPSSSKAQALQASQRKLLGDRRYRHPCYWAPYIIIGNWL
ncbi:MAG TPA: CHAT domain-containing protein [Candidatus Dormibacteraeota bacterium]|nr:CHAT domain-containing protein [Candidatus Dormibacteraeota bacterium]